MVKYRENIECYFNGMKKITIESSAGSSRHTIHDIASKAKEKRLGELTKTMSDHWSGGFHFPKGRLQAREYF